MTTTSSNTGGMMDTERGGENTQYESIKTVTEEPDKQSGQLGGDMPNTTSTTSKPTQSQGEKTAENIRYGQNISETGMGGMTQTSSGSANQEGGYGGAVRDSRQESTDDGRGSQGYGPGNEMRHDVGA